MLLRGCISYFPVAMITFHGQEQLEEERLYFGLQVQRARALVAGKAMVWWEQEARRSSERTVK